MELGFSGQQKDVLEEEFLKEMRCSNFEQGLYHNYRLKAVGKAF